MLRKYSSEEERTYVCTTMKRVTYTVVGSSPDQKTDKFISIEPLISAVVGLGGWKLRWTLLSYDYPEDFFFF